MSYTDQEVKQTDTEVAAGAGAGAGAGGSQQADAIELQGPYRELYEAMSVSWKTYDHISNGNIHNFGRSLNFEGVSMLLPPKSILDMLPQPQFPADSPFDSETGAVDMSKLNGFDSVAKVYYEKLREVSDKFALDQSDNGQFKLKAELKKVFAKYFQENIGWSEEKVKKFFSKPENNLKILNAVSCMFLMYAFPVFYNEHPEQLLFFKYVQKLDDKWVNSLNEGNELVRKFVINPAGELTEDNAVLAEVLASPNFESSFDGDRKFAYEHCQENDVIFSLQSEAVQGLDEAELNTLRHLVRFLNFLKLRHRDDKLPGEDELLKKVSSFLEGINQSKSKYLSALKDMQGSSTSEILHSFANNNSKLSWEDKNLIFKLIFEDEKIFNKDAILVDIPKPGIHPVAKALYATVGVAAVATAAYFLAPAVTVLGLTITAGAAIAGAAAVAAVVAAGIFTAIFKGIKAVYNYVNSDNPKAEAVTVAESGEVKVEPVPPAPVAPVSSTPPSSARSVSSTEGHSARATTPPRAGSPVSPHTAPTPPTPASHASSVVSYSPSAVAVAFSNSWGEKYPKGVQFDTNEHRGRGSMPTGSASSPDNWKKQNRAGAFFNILEDMDGGLVGNNTEYVNG